MVSVVKFIAERGLAFRDDENVEILKKELGIQNRGASKDKITKIYLMQMKGNEFACKFQRTV